MSPPRGSGRAGDRGASVLGAHAPSYTMSPLTGLWERTRSRRLGPRGSRPELYDVAPDGALGAHAIAAPRSSGLTPRAIRCRPLGAPGTTSGTGCARKV